MYTLSSQSRYDHFDTSPYIPTCFHRVFSYSFFAKRDVPLCPVAVSRNFSMHFRAKISTAATPFCSLLLPPAALTNVPSSILLRIYQPAFTGCFPILFSRNGTSRYVLLRCPKLFMHFRAKISTAATPFCSLLLPPAALANVPTSILLRIKLKKALLTKCFLSRDDRIRTCGPYVPNVVLYQTEPHPDF